MASFFRFMRVCMSFVTVGVVHAVVKKIIYSVSEIYSILLMAHESKLKIWTIIKETEGKCLERPCVFLWKCLSRN